MSCWLRILTTVLMAALISACAVQPVVPAASTSAPAEETAAEAEGRAKSYVVN